MGWSPLSKDTLYLLEARHAMTIEKIKAISERVNQFPKMIERYPQKEFGVKYWVRVTQNSSFSINRSKIDCVFDACHKTLVKINDLKSFTAIKKSLLSIYHVRNRLRWEMST